MAAQTTPCLLHLRVGSALEIWKYTAHNMNRETFGLSEWEMVCSLCRFGTKDEPRGVSNHEHFGY